MARTAAGAARVAAWEAILLLLLVSCSRSGEPLPGVALARVPAASKRARTPPVIVTVTPQEVVVDAPRRPSRGEAARPERERYPLSASAWRGPEGELMRHLEGLFADAGLTMHDDTRVDVAQLRLRVAADLHFDDLVEVLIPIARAGFGALEFEVTSDAGTGHLTVRPYTYCACPMPPAPRWCAAPNLEIDRRGVVLFGEADLVPLPGCHKAIPRMGESEPAFDAGIDWRGRAIAGPDHDCLSAPVGPRGLDVDALAARLHAIREAAPGCGWGSLSIDGETPWSVVAPTLATLYAEFGEVRTLMQRSDEYDAKRRARACSDPLPVDALRPAPPTPALLGRAGCGESSGK